jgi:hypothetical protein
VSPCLISTQHERRADDQQDDSDRPQDGDLGNESMNPTIGRTMPRAIICFSSLISRIDTNAPELSSYPYQARWN